MPADAAATKTMPHDLEAERAVLGAVLLEGKAIFTASEILRPEDFYHPGHRIIFARMLELAMESKPVDLFTLRAELVRHAEEEKAGGPAYLAALTDGLPRSTNVGHYSRIVREKATARMLIRLCATTAEKCYEGEDTAGQLLDEHESELFKIAARSSDGGFESAESLVARAYREIEEVARNKRPVVGIETGFGELDKMTAGLHRQNLVIVAGRPRLGKTAFCCELALHAALEGGKSVGIFSLEMSKDELIRRMKSSRAEVELHRIRTGFLSKDDWARLGRAACELSKARLYIDDTGALTVMQLRAKAQRLALEHGLDLVIVDYLQLLRGSAKRYESRTQEVTEVSWGLKALAKELDIPVVAATQLSRDVEKSDRRPRLSDLRESGSIEQDADLVIFIHRNSASRSDDGAAPCATDIIIGKQRNGREGSFELLFMKQFTKFANMIDERQPELWYQKD